MRHYLNERLVRRNSLIGKILVWGGLGTAIGSVLISLQTPTTMNPYVFGGFLGVLAAQIGTLMSNRWGRRPRLDEFLSDGLKGLDDRYAVFHYLLAADHALLTPNGVFVFALRTEEGEIDCQDGKWIQRREKRGLLRRGGTRQIPNVERLAQSAASKLERRLSKLLDEESLPGVQPVVVFLHPEANLLVEDPPLPTVHIKKLKTWLRRLPKSPGLEPKHIDSIAAALNL